jgi:L-aminopeptidase/D-esterase-like protein
VIGADFSPLGLVIGHATDDDGATGCTVIRPHEGPMRCCAAVIGRATGTRELAVASPDHLVDVVDAVMLTGGSAYGLDAAAGVMRWMEERGRGYPIGPGVVPLVPAAVIFDLAPLGKFSARPTPDMAYSACETATSDNIAEGSVGAGTGATVGKGAGPGRAMKGGVGAWTERSNDLVVGAVAVVNALGDVRDAKGAIIAGARGDAASFIDSMSLFAHGKAQQRADEVKLRNTTISLVATNAVLSRVELLQLARASSAALYRRITPTGTTYDGDVIFAVCPLDGPTVSQLSVEALSVEVLETAIERAVRTAKGRDGVPGMADREPGTGNRERGAGARDRGS